MTRASVRRVALAMAALLVLAWATSCGPGPIARASLADLASDQEAWDGRLVSTEGVVRTFDRPRHHWIEDAELNRVEVVPSEAVASLVGRRVRVEGRFTFRDDEGRRIVVSHLEVLDDPTRP